MIIDEAAGSGGDLLPWMFRKLSLDPLIGRRTWAGLVGIFGFPALQFPAPKAQDQRTFRADGTSKRPCG